MAAEALGWSGVVVPNVSLLGTLVSMVVALDTTAHRWRLEHGCAQPLLDPDELTMWEWPEGRGVFPPSAVSITGVLAHRGRSVRGAICSARKWRGFGATALLLTQDDDSSPDLLLECAYSGIAVVREERNDAKVLQAGRDGRVATARRTTVDRWVEEQLYGHVLAQLPDALL